VDGDSPSTAAMFYFFAHLLEEVSHWPPAFSQSAWVLYCEKSPEVDDELGVGLAEGEAPAPLGEPEPPLEVGPPPLVPELPDGAPEPEPPAAPLPLPLPLPLCAATSAGVSVMIPTSRRPRNLVMIELLQG
jgi:hypothetical protein